MGVAGDEVRLRLRMTVLAGGAAGASSPCFPAQLLTYVPGLKDGTAICW